MAAIEHVRTGNDLVCPLQRQFECEQPLFARDNRSLTANNLCRLAARAVSMGTGLVGSLQGMFPMQTGLVAALQRLFAAKQTLWRENKGGSQPN